MVVELEPLTPSHTGLLRRRPLRQARPVGGGAVEVGGKAAMESNVKGV
jgi:hypothetical protein